MRVTFKYILFGLCAVYMVLGPAIPQFLGVGYPWIRSWVMYGAVGTGVLKGEFSYTSTAGEKMSVSPIEILGEDKFYDQDWFKYENLIHSIDDMYAFTADWCAENPEEGRDLAYNGLVGQGKGWATLEVTELCDAPKTEDTLELAHAKAY